MSYGIKVYDEAGNSAVLSEKVGKILVSGSLNMPDSLNGDGTYGVDVDLPGTDAFSRDEIGVIVYPVTLAFKGVAVTYKWEDDDSFPFSWFASDLETYYTKNPSNGVMSSWTAGSIIKNDANSFDGIASAFPLAGWDYLDSETTFTKIRIWAAMAYLVYDSSASAFKAVYTIGVNGIKKVEYMVFLR